MANFVIIAVLLVALSTTATVTDAQQAQATCAQKLVSCAAYISNATIKPRDDCCNPIKEAVATELPCLCNLYKDPKVFASFGINVTDALRITRECGVSTDLSNCNGTSPTSATPPPGRGPGPVNQNGGAGRISLTGFTVLFLYFLYSIVLTFD